MAEHNPNALTLDWPNPSLRPYELWRGYQESDYSGAEVLAEDLRRKFAADVAPRAMLLTVCAEKNWHVVCDRIGSDRTSTIRAVAVNMHTGGFHFVLNSDYTYGEQTESVETALIAHEVCHAAVFYYGDMPPKRRIRLTQNEHVFCDTFAQSLTGVNLQEAINDLSVLKARRS